MRLAMLLMTMLALGACDTARVPLADSQADAAGRRFAPPPGQGSIYVYRGGDSGTLFSIMVGRREFGPIGNYSWFVADVEPGTHDVRCTGGENSRILPVSVAAGEARFVLVDALSGWWTLRCGITEQPESIGKPGVLAGKRAAEIR